MEIRNIRIAQFLIALLLILFGIVFRLSPHPANVAPIAAIALFSGVYLTGKWKIFIPIVAMLVSDFFIGFYEWPILLTVYGCFAATIAIGALVKRNKNTGSVIAGSLSASILFFLATNAAVWMVHSETYAPDLSGLLASYTLAIPFFRNTMLGDLFFTGALFGAYEVVFYAVKQRKFLDFWLMRRL